MSCPCAAASTAIVDRAPRRAGACAPCTCRSASCARSSRDARATAGRWSPRARRWPDPSWTIDHVPVVLDCTACWRTTTVEHALVLTCAACGSGDVRLRTGEEFMVTSMDVDPPASDPPDRAGSLTWDASTATTTAPTRTTTRQRRARARHARRRITGDHSALRDRLGAGQRPGADLRRERPRRRGQPGAASTPPGQLREPDVLPGAGKTTLLRPHPARTCATTGSARASSRATSRPRSTPTGWPGSARRSALLNTGDGFGGECHLDAPMVRPGPRPARPRARWTCCIVENVGNLVCPAEFDVGAHDRAMVCAITEGEEKPLKYPVMFRAVSVVLVNKMDLLPYLDFDLDLFRRNVATVNPSARLSRSAREPARASTRGTSGCCPAVHADLGAAAVTLPRIAQVDADRLPLDLPRRPTDATRAAARTARTPSRPVAAHSPRGAGRRPHRGRRATSVRCSAGDAARGLPRRTTSRPPTGRSTG